ncbi:MAG: acyltransferase [Hyphomicrobium sp.]|jgi:peptidoglycan/LPS O-acetylase OafA/YrhL
MRLELLDYVRLSAALAVLWFHYCFNGIANGKVTGLTHTPLLAGAAQYGYLGVALFFMISGYVIFLSAARRTAIEFVGSRMLRLFPAFWAAMLTTALFATAWGGDKMSVSIPQIIANSIMVPSVFGYAPVDGVYWTLKYEIIFYLSVTTLLGLRLGAYLPQIALVWPLVQLVLSESHNNFALMSGWYCFFAAGSCLAAMKSSPTPWVLPALMVSLFLCCKFAVTTARPELSHLVVGSLIVLFFILLALLSLPKFSELRLPGAAYAAALSYTIYLVHAHIGYMTLSQLSPIIGPVGAYLATLMLVFGLAVAIHLLVERRLRPFWTWLFHFANERPS